MAPGSLEESPAKKRAKSSSREIVKFLCLLFVFWVVGGNVFGCFFCLCFFFVMFWVFFGKLGKSPGVFFWFVIVFCVLFQARKKVFVFFLLITWLFRVLDIFSCI